MNSTIFADTLIDGYASSKIIVNAFYNSVLRAPETLLVITSVFGSVWLFKKIYSFLSMLFSVYIARGRNVSSPPPPRHPSSR